MIHDERPARNEWRPWRLWSYIRRLESGLEVAHARLVQLGDDQVTGATG